MRFYYIFFFDCIRFVIWLIYVFFGFISVLPEFRLPKLQQYTQTQFEVLRSWKILDEIFAPQHGKIGEKQKLCANNMFFFSTSIPCCVFVVVVVQNPLSIFDAYLLISYELLRRPFLFVYFRMSVEFMVFYFTLLSFRFDVSFRYRFFFRLSHCSSDNNLSISATFRCILKSYDESFLLLFFFCCYCCFYCFFRLARFPVNTSLWNESSFQSNWK